MALRFMIRSPPSLTSVTVGGSQILTVGFAIDRLPELIEALRNETRQLHERIAKKVADARSILNMLNQCGSRPETAEVQK